MHAQVSSLYYKAKRKRPRWLRDKVLASKSDSPEDPSRIGPVARYVIRRGYTSNVYPLVWCNTTHPDPAYPTGFKALKSRRGRELTSSRTQAPLAFIKNLSSYIHTTPRNMGGN
ncbi:hypothetical protein AVEN_114149-1 [Araneus ventricosus]|uniref:Uncharacterized protein n=1 Tax=Araneus ventricosus TaxID=182803 RepID=A0A4Y2V7R3_ARAVE|nr:hypothetical protein AVEN_114149-1 [Araneus ventricosus]